MSTKDKRIWLLHILGADMFKFYDLNTGKVHPKNRYLSSGPGALNSIYGFYILNANSVFLSQQYHYRVLLEKRILRRLTSLAWLLKMWSLKNQVMCRKKVILFRGQISQVDPIDTYIWKSNNSI
jgi:hypothetical protein